MSRYVRDDKEFREKIRSLAGVGLRFPTNPDPIVTGPLASIDMSKMRGESLRNLRAQGFTPDFQRELDRITNAKSAEEVAAAVNGALDQMRVEYNMPKTPRKLSVSACFAGLVWWSPVIAAVIAFLHWVIVRGGR